MPPQLELKPQGRKPKKKGRKSVTADIIILQAQQHTVERKKR